MTGTDQVYLGIDWAGEVPAMRLAEAGSAAPARMVPLEGAVRFRAVEQPGRFCGGWFDLSGPDGRHVVCDSWQLLETGRQCGRCRQREGFLSAHQGFDAAVSQMPTNLRDYLALPHRLYVDVFADGTIKVGTVAERRLYARLAEQGPVAASYVARTSDGLEVRRLEAAVSRRFGLPQAVTSARKVRALTVRVDPKVLRDEVRDIAAQVCAFVAELAQAGSAAVPIDPPEPWQSSAIADAVFEATPATLYPDPLTTGPHSLYLQGLSGSVALFGVVPDEGADLYVAGLDQLHGAVLSFGDYESQVGAVQPALF